MNSYIVGDSAYLLLQQIQDVFIIMKMVKKDKDAFSKSLKRGQVKIENAFEM